MQTTGRPEGTNAPLSDIDCTSHMNAQTIIDVLGLEPLPAEGGMFAETYRSTIDMPTSLLGSAYTGPMRQLSTAIYFMLTPDMVSLLHRVPGDEIYHFYIGDPVEQLRLHPDGTSEIVRLGHDILAGERPQVVIEGGVWQGSRVCPGGKFALMGATMAPGFSFGDFGLGDRVELQSRYPDHSSLIEELT